jgi:hypothetical protein
MAAKLIKSGIAGAGSIGKATKDPMLSTLASLFEELVTEIGTDRRERKRKKSNLFDSNTTSVVTKPKKSKKVQSPAVSSVAKRSATTQAAVSTTHIENSFSGMIATLGDMFKQSLRREPKEEKKKRSDGKSRSYYSDKRDKDKQPSGALLLRLNRKVSRTNELLTQMNKNMVSGFRLLHETMKDCCAGNSNGEKMMELKNSIVNLSRKTAISKKSGKPLAGAALTAVLDRAEEKSRDRDSAIASMLESMISKVPTRAAKKSASKKNKTLSESDLIEKINLLNREKYEKMFSVFFDRMKLGFEKTVSAILSLNNMFLTKVDEIGKEVKDPILSMISKFIPFIFGTVKAAWKFIWGIPKTLVSIKDILRDTNQKISELTKKISDENELIRESVKGTKSVPSVPAAPKTSAAKESKSEGRGISGIVDTLLNIFTLKALAGRGGAVVGKLGKVLPFLGKIAGRLGPVGVAAGVGYSAYDKYKETGSVGKAATTGGSALGGAMLGAKIGAAGGPVGIALGAVIGGIAGNFIGDKLADNFSSIKKNFLSMWNSTFSDSANILDKLSSLMKESLSDLVEKMKTMWNGVVKTLPVPSLFKEGLYVEETPKKIDVSPAQQERVGPGNEIYKGLAGSNVNPGNIRQGKSKKKDIFFGTVGFDEKGFNKFENELYGIRAMFRQFETYKKSGKETPEQMIKTYAPKADGNNLEKYRINLEKQGVKWNKKLSTDQELIQFASAVSNAENSTLLLDRFTQDQLQSVLNSARLNDIAAIRKSLEKVEKSSTKPILSLKPDGTELSLDSKEKRQPNKVSAIPKNLNINPIGPVVEGPFLNAESVIARNSPTPVLSMNPPPIIAPTMINNMNGGSGGSDNSFGPVASPRSVENTFEKASHDSFTLSLFRTHLA